MNSNNEVPDVGSANTPKLIAAVAALAWLGLVLQLPITVGNELAKGRSVWFAVAIYLGYFTIISNVVCALVLSSHALQRWENWFIRCLRTHWLSTSATVAISITFLVYNVVLRGTHHVEGSPLWVDSMLHVFTPMAMLVFWWRTTPKGALHWGLLPRIAAYPAAYIVYYFVRGEFMNHYPYFFMNVNTQGYWVAICNASLVTLVFTALGCGMVWLKLRPSRA